MLYNRKRINYENILNTEFAHATIIRADRRLGFGLAKCYIQPEHYKTWRLKLTEYLTQIENTDIIKK
jgi:hypothetical protein